jgi:hypothetical protein
VGAARPACLKLNARLIEEQAAMRALAKGCAAEWVTGQVFDAAAALLAISEQVTAYLERFPAACGRVHVCADQHADGYSNADQHADSDSYGNADQHADQHTDRASLHNHDCDLPGRRRRVDRPEQRVQ